VIWFANDDGNMCAYTPIYCASTVAPECYATPGADALTFSMDNAYWVCNWVSNMVYPRYSLMFGSLEAVRDSLDQSYSQAQKGIEEHAMRLYENDPQSAVKYLNDYGNQKAAEMLVRWKQLAVYLIVKYNDMAVKPEEKGVFVRTKTGLGAPVKRPGFPSAFVRKYIKQTGDKFAYPD